jgi:hypothetical protein
LKCRLALALRKTLQELDQDVSAAEFTTWKAFDQLQPIGDETTQQLLAECLCYVHNLWTDTDKCGKRSIADFLPHFGTRKATLSEVDSGGIAIHPRLAEFRRRSLE